MYLEVPTLILWGDEDQFLSHGMTDANGNLVKDLTVKHIAKCSHWVQVDQFEQVNQYMGDFGL